MTDHQIQAMDEHSAKTLLPTPNLFPYNVPLIFWVEVMLAMIKHMTFIAIGGALGAVSRFVVTATLQQRFENWEFPIGTLTVNVLGCLLMGFLVVILIDKFQLSLAWRGMILTGFLGAFTTFSAFAVETLSLLEHSLWREALLSVLLNVFLSISAALLGVYLGEKLIGH